MGDRGFMKWVKQKVNNKRIEMNPYVLSIRINIKGLNIVKRPQPSDGIVKKSATYKECGYQQHKYTNRKLKDGKICTRKLLAKIK